LRISLSKIIFLLNSSSCEPQGQNQFDIKKANKATNAAAVRLFNQLAKAVRLQKWTMPKKHSCKVTILGGFFDIFFGLFGKDI